MLHEVAEGSSEDGGDEVKQEDLAMSNDAARDGPIKAVEEADMVRDTAKESMDGAWIAAQEASHKGTEISGNRGRQGDFYIIAINFSVHSFLNASSADFAHWVQGGDSIVGASAQGAVKATEVLENVGERAKETVDTALDAAKKTTEGVTETTTMVEADNNVVDTVEYRCTEDLRGQLGDGHDSYN
ncbi:hypothetical protein JHK87_037412 [Glycine soja]|nr:hypothetical protein JHK87_037412 [Glycine soja]